ncbi:MAG: thioredoxin family protein [Saprospiraceae bacterium]
MKKYILLASAGILCLSLAAFTFLPTSADSGSGIAGDAIKWMTWEEAVAANKITPKKIVVDVYTHWCGWCKVMDRETFTKPEIIKYVNDNYYAVKLNAEQREDIIFDNRTFSFVASGNGGVHSFAATLLDNNMSYPTLVYLTERFERVVISPGFKKPEQLIKELKFTGENAYAKMSWDQYMGDSSK